METDCLPLLEIIISCYTPNLTMLMQIAYIMLMYLEFKHIGKNDNVVADMLLQARYNDEGAMVDGEEDVGNNFYSMTLTRRNEIGLATPLELVLA